jgi:hypothetical protein
VDYGPGLVDEEIKALRWKERKVIDKIILKDKNHFLQEHSDLTPFVDYLSPTEYGSDQNYCFVQEKEKKMKKVTTIFGTTMGLGRGQCYAQA